MTNETTQTDKDLIAEFLKDHDVTQCPVGAAKGNNLSKLAREDVAKQRREERKNG